MGTNYYARENECKHCNRYDDIHLGKSSGGWHFTFQYNHGKYYKDVNEMKKWLKGKKIYNEYDEKISNKDFWEMVKAKQKNVFISHAVEYPNNSLLIDGYSFSDCEFS